MWHIYGHEWAIEQLRSNIRTQRVAHAYLFTGPSGIGKSLLALRMAQALLCEQQTGDPCLQCRTCRRIERESHPDVRVASMKKKIMKRIIIINAKKKKKKGKNEKKEK